MGVVYTTIKVRNPLKGADFIELEAKVDTGATILVLPKSVTDELELKKIREEKEKKIKTQFQSATNEVDRRWRVNFPALVRR